MLDSELRKKNLCGIKTSKSRPTITHVTYANDIILFSKASKKNAATISRILEKYNSWSSQLVNRNKSGIYFSKFTQSATRRNIKSILQVKTLKNDVVYLGALFLFIKSPLKRFFLSPA